MSDLNHNDKENDVVSSASKVSKVSKSNKTPLNNKTNIIIGLILLGIVLLIIFSGGHKRKTEVTDTATVAPQTTAELQENLTKLQQLNQNLQQQAQQITQDSSAGNPDENSQTLARQNAPTNMFSASPQADGGSNQTTSGTSGNPNQPTLAGQGTYTQFANQNMQTSSINATQIAHPKYTIASGEFIHAVLESALDSDLPGEIRAVISTPVYAYVGDSPLIPAGSRLIGQYSSSVLQGQDRVFVIWNRIILPNGIAVQLNSPGVDAIGQPGMGADSINTHFFSRFGEAGLLSIIGAGAANVGVTTGDQYNSASEYRTAIAQSFQQSANDSLQNSTQMGPTLRIYQGAEINVFVAHDLDFYNVLAQQDDMSQSNTISEGN